MRPIIKHGLIGIGAGLAAYIFINKHCNADPSQVSGLASSLSGGGGAAGGIAAAPMTDMGSADDTADTADDTASCPTGYHMENGQCTPDNVIQTPPVQNPPSDTTTPPPSGTGTTPPPSGGGGVCPAGYKDAGMVTTRTVNGDQTCHMCDLIDMSQAGSKPARITIAGSCTTTPVAGASTGSCPAGETWDVNKPGGPGCVRSANSASQTTTRGSRAGARPTEVPGTATRTPVTTASAPQVSATSRTGARGGTPILPGTSHAVRAVMADGYEQNDPDYSLLDDATRNFMLGFSKRLN